MWMKAEPIENVPTVSCPAGLTAPLAGSVQLAQRQGKHYPSLAWARPTQRERWNPSPTPVLSPEAGEDIGLMLV